MPNVMFHMINGNFYHGTIPLDVLVDFKKTQIVKSLKKWLGKHKTLAHHKK